MRTTARAGQNRSAWIDDLSRRLHLDGDRWHDGRLAGLSIDTGSRGAKASVGVVLRVEVYGEGERAARRTPMTVTFGGVHDLVTAVNCRELVDMGDDHIVFARLNETAEMLDLCIYVSGGHVRIVADRLTVATALSRRRRPPRSSD